MMLWLAGLLYVIAGALALATAAQSRELAVERLRAGLVDFVLLLPRMVVGVIGAGYVAAILPQDEMARWLGPSSGLAGAAIATLAGAITPGGPVVGFSIGVAALKGGAAAPQVIAYVTAWALFAFHRAVMYEIPMMPARIVWLRILVSLPLPFLAAAGAILIGRP